MKAALFFSIAFIMTTYAQQDGTVALFRNGTSSRSYTSGIVQVYYRNDWTGICYDSSFGDDEADVICRQLGYDGADDHSTAGDEAFGSIQTATISDVSCRSRYYQVLFQCSVSVTADTCDVDNAVIVSCSNKRTWDSPYSGQVRLTGGDYTSSGIVETYCNDGWGQVCNSGFDGDAAKVVCEQLGYETSGSFNGHSRNISRPIWLNSPSCSSTDDCLSSCQACPSKGTTTVNCTAGDSVAYVNCNADPNSSSNTDIFSCDPDYAAASAILVAILVGVFVSCCCVIILCITVPLGLCCCLGGVAFGATSFKK